MWFLDLPFFLWSWLLRLFFSITLNRSLGSHAGQTEKTRFCFITFFSCINCWHSWWRPPCRPPPTVLQSRGWVKRKVIMQQWQDTWFRQHIVKFNWICAAALEEDTSLVWAIFLEAVELQSPVSHGLCCSNSWACSLILTQN